MPCLSIFALIPCKDHIMSSSTVAIKLGRTIGATAAYVGHAAIATTKATGRFGEDVLLGTQAGYLDHSTRLAALREAAKSAGVKQQRSLKTEIIRVKTAKA
jgi:hypothetical protein